MTVQEARPQIPWAVLSTRHCKQECLLIGTALKAQDTPSVPRFTTGASKQNTRGRQQTLATTRVEQQGGVLRERRPQQQVLMDYALLFGQVERI